MRTREVKKQMDMIWESYIMGEPVKEEDHRGHGHDCKKVHPDQSHDEWKKKDKKEEKVEEGGDHWSQMPAAQTLKNFEKAIADLEPAGDVREWYIDAVDKDIDVSILDKILARAVESGDLHAAEAHFIKTGQQDHPDQDPSDVGHRGFDRPKQEGLDDEERDRLTNLGPVNDVPYDHPDEGQYDKAKQFIDWLTSSHNQAAKKYLHAFRDPGANAMDLGREIYGNMSPELQREYDQDVLIDAIEDKLAEAGMRPKESTVPPFDEFYKQT